MGPRRIALPDECKRDSPYRAFNFHPAQPAIVQSIQPAFPDRVAIANPSFHQSRPLRLRGRKCAISRVFRFEPKRGPPQAAKL